MAIPLQETSGAIVSNLLRILILIRLFVTTIAQPECIRCEDFNRIQPQGCAQDYTQCGGCLTNFIEDTDDPRICYALEILTAADDEISQKANFEVHLVCKFNALVNCKWSKDGEVVKDIGPESNRQWMTGEGKRSDDCSLTINRMSEEDVGSWVCSSMADSNFNELSSKPTQLYIQPTLIESPNAYYEVEEGNSVTLPCVFDQNVVCYWTKNGRLTSSNENYQVTTNASDCSLTIDNVAPMDSGKWKCTAPGTSKRDPVSSPPTTLIVTKAKTKENPMIYNGVEMVNGATLTFPAEEALAALHCQMPSKMPSGSRIWWVLHNDGVYQEQSNGLLNVGPELYMAMVKQLQQQNKIELICMVEDELKRVSNANVFFISDVFPKPEVAATASKLDTIIIMLSVFTSIVAIVIGALIFILMRRKSNLRRGSNTPLPNADTESHTESKMNLLQRVDANEASETS